MSAPMDTATLMGISPVIPVLVIERVEDAVPLGRALVEGGLKVLEITLRTPVALEVIRRLKGEVEGAVVGAGTVRNPDDLQRSADAGAVFAVSPGLTQALAEPGPIPLLPGAATGSDIMRALDAGIRQLKFFPAVPSGGIPALKAFAGPFADVRFCPTGGIDLKNAPDFLALPNVGCVGGSWVAPADAVRGGDWNRIRGLAREASGLKRPAH